MTHGSFDLMPASCRVALERRLLVRRWGAAYAASAIAVVLAALVLDARRDDRGRAVEALEERARQNWLRNEEAQRLVSEITELSGRITRYHRLAWPVQATDVLDTLGAVMPEDVTLRSLTFAPRQDKVTETPTAGGQPVTRTVTTLAVELEGISPTDMDVAALVSRLDQSALFRSVRLDFSRSTEINGHRARRFRTQGEVDLDRRYVFVDADTEEGR